MALDGGRGRCREGIDTAHRYYSVDGQLQLPLREDGAGTVPQLCSCVHSQSRPARCLTWAAIDGVDPVDHCFDVIAIVSLGCRVGVKVEGCGSRAHSPVGILLEAIVVLQARAERLWQASQCSKQGARHAWAWQHLALCCHDVQPRQHRARSSLAEPQHSVGGRSCGVLTCQLSMNDAMTYRHTQAITQAIEFQ